MLISAQHTSSFNVSSQKFCMILERPITSVHLIMSSMLHPTDYFGLEDTHWLCNIKKFTLDITCITIGNPAQNQEVIKL
jgi:hypothetical protein